MRQSARAWRSWLARTGAVVLAGLLGVVLGPGAAGAAVVPPELHRRAAAGGMVPVIVRLDVPFTAEGIVGEPGAVAAQWQGIARAQASVVSALAGVSHQVRHQYRAVPLLAIATGLRGSGCWRACRRFSG
jgi:hypothetical protein